MNIDATAINYIQEVIKVADLVKIGNIAVESGRIRGMDENQQVFILQTDGVPAFEFGSIGLNRLPEFVARFNMARAATNFAMDATVETNNGNSFVRAINMKGKGLKVDYRCANPATILAPKNLKSDFNYTFELSSEAATYMHQGQSAYKCETVSFIGTEQGVTMNMVDVNNDKMEYEASTQCDSIAGEEEFKFTYKYPIKMLLPLLKATSNYEICINAQGILRIHVGGFNVHLWAVQ